MYFITLFTHNHILLIKVIKKAAISSLTYLYKFQFTQIQLKRHIFVRRGCLFERGTRAAVFIVPVTIVYF